MRPYAMALDSLSQLVTPTMDGDVVSKQERDHYIALGWAKRERCADGYARTSLTAKGMIALGMVKAGHSVAMH